MDFPVHDTASAPAASQGRLQAIVDRYGFIPNLAGVFAESPGALNGLLSLLGAYDAPEISLSTLERQVVLLAVSVENRCEYCTAAHGMLASMNGLDRDQIVNIQEEQPVEDPRLETLRRFTRAVVERRGRPTEDDLQAFESAGFTRAHVLEVVLGIAVKTLTNYANHIAHPPVNEQFAEFLPSWKEAAA